MYTNQTAEELDLMRCTSEGIFKAQNSNWTKFVCILVFFLIFLTFFLSFKAAKMLKNRNIYSHGSQILLLSTLLNANLNQAVFLEIKVNVSSLSSVKVKYFQIRQLIHILINSKDPCKIEFRSSECFYDQSVYAFSNILSTALVSALTCDRFIAFLFSHIYPMHSKIVSIFLLFLSMFFTLLIHLHTYGGVSRAGYVPSCQYPPQLSLDAFDIVNSINFWFILVNCALTVVILLLNFNRDKKVKKSVFDTKIKYNSFENLLTTKAICSITFTQFAFLSFSTGAVTIISSIEAGISEEVFHIVAQSLTGLVYANVSIPVIILLKTKQCIEQRRISIDKMTTSTNHADYYMTSLRASWEKF
ncbi:CRE-SRA-27 protein [Caenorhabditis remanei]|uniref:CRE-SRA-27 protein n=1 Tax=Caenorhabditis remanei TaxID=31234 RepID=E3LR13_CAERE|nr:CRE-SRA-27 protein [Caenorhabditis remanei]